jgi:hypothetical protein
MTDETNKNDGKDAVIGTLKKQLEDTQSALAVANAKNSAATQTLGQIMGDNVDLKASCILMKAQVDQANHSTIEQVNQINGVNGTLRAEIGRLQEELKNLLPEETAKQLIELNNEQAKLTAENARLNRVVGAMEREIFTLRENLGISQKQQNENSDAA